MPNINYSRGALHIGQRFCTRIHLCTHSVWKACIHGKYATSVPSLIGFKQIPHVPASELSSGRENERSSYRTCRSGFLIRAKASGVPGSPVHLRSFLSRNRSTATDKSPVSAVRRNVVNAITRKSMSKKETERVITTNC